MELTLSEAAKQAKVAKSTISRSIEKGRLSARKDDLGRYRIDTSELFRVFAPIAHATTEVQQKEHDATALKQEVEHLRSMLAQMRDQLDDTKVDRDHWRDQAKQLAIPHLKEFRPWWKRLIG